MKIQNDLFNISKRIKEIDDGYFIVYNSKLNRFELHHERSNPTFEIVLPFPTLDARSLLYARLTRVIGKGNATFDKIERQNAELERLNMERMRDESVFRLRHSLGVII